MASGNSVRKHIIFITVENKFGVLARVAGLFSARGYNIDSLCVSATDDPSVSTMTLMVEGDDRILEQVFKQLNKLIDVIKVQDLSGGDFIDRELALIRVKTANLSARQDIMQMVTIFRAKIVDVGRKTLTIELVGSSSKVDALIELLKPLGVKELIRTGKVAILRENGK